MGNIQCMIPVGISLYASQNWEVQLSGALLSAVLLETRRRPSLLLSSRISAFLQLRWFTRSIDEWLLAGLLVGLLVWSAWSAADGWLMYKNVRMQAQQHQFINNIDSENTRSEQTEIHIIIF